MAGSGSERATSQPAALASVGFFRLPIEIRKNIYQRVLIVPHPLYLFQDPGCQVETFAPEKPYRWLALLYTNRQISDEARAVLYGMNHFALQEATQRQGSLLKSFLTCIGPVNAGLLSHLCIDFPATERIDGQSGDLKLRDDSLQSLELLQRECTNLKTLETLIYGQNSGGLMKEDQISFTFLREIFLKIDAQFKEIASLEKIIVRIYSGTPTASVREFLQGLGWVVLLGDR
ncbi:hypothetical protein BBP40_001331 [Aspergillus hancockii]|nr:hypothetical protein BBP40_001331 [Aspergillus hancockii]